MKRGYDIHTGKPTGLEVQAMRVPPIIYFGVTTCHQRDVGRLWPRSSGLLPPSPQPRRPPFAKIRPWTSSGRWPNVRSWTWVLQDFRSAKDYPFLR